MKMTYQVQFIIDIVVVFLGMICYFFPEVASLNASMLFYIMISIYAGLNLCEYIFDNTRKEPLELFLASATAAFSGLVLRDLDANYVLSITIAVWTLMVIIIKVISLEEIFEKKTHLFLIKLTVMSVVALIGILVSINLFYHITSIGYMLGFMFMAFGGLELMGDFLSFLSENSRFLKE